MRSLRARLVIGTIAATTLVFVICGTALYISIRAAMWSEFDNATLTKARTLAAMVEVRAHNRFMVELEDWQLPEFHRGERPEYFQVYWIEGKITVRSDSLGTSDLPMDGPSGSARPIVLPDGRAGRVVLLRFEPRLEVMETDQPPAGNAVLALARGTQNLDHVLARVSQLLVVICGGAIVASSGLMLWVVGRALKPIDTLAAQIAGVGDANLSERIDDAPIPSELRPLVARLNELLGRVDAALVRERAFSADVAHELRTPLAGLQTALEVAASQQRQPAEYERVIAKCLVATRGLRTMVDNLLTLARAEAGQLQLTREPVSVEQLAKESWAPLDGRARERQLQIDWKVQPDCDVRSDRAMLGLVVRNLFENAVSYCNTGGTVRVNASRNGDGLHFRVANTGSNLQPDQASRVFERFWRADSSRGAGANCGLGLTLCQKIVGALGGTIGIKTTVGGMFEVDVRLSG